MTYRRTLGAVDLPTAIADISATFPTADQKPDPFAIAVATGILPNTTAGRAQFDAMNGTYGGNQFGGNLANAIVSQPALAALLVVWQAINGNDNSMPGAHVDWTTLLSIITNYAARSAVFSNGLELPASVSMTAAAPYLDAVEQLFPIVLEDFAQNDAGAGGRYAEAALLAQYQAALAAGATTLGPYGAVPTSLVAQGPVQLPDGNVYAVVNDISGDPSLSYVSWWKNASRYVPGVGVGHYADECGIAPGTGDWYMLGSIGATCPAPPAGWVSDGFALVSTRARQSLMLSSENTLAPVGTDTALIPYTGPVVSAPTGGGTSVVPVTQPVLISPPVEVGTLPSNGQAPGGGLPMATPFLFNKNELLLALGVGAVVIYALHNKGRR